MTMTAAEVKRLYAVLVSYDQRKLSEANLNAWAHQAELNRWTLDEAVAAVHEHYRFSPQFCYPAHVNEIIRASRRQPERIDPSRQLPAQRAQPTRVRAVISELAGKLGWHSREPEALAGVAVECPYCHSPAGRWCVRLVTRGPHRGEYVQINRLHGSRIDLAKEAA